MLENKIALVTGASRGIGKKVAEKLAEQGAIVYANARVETCLTEWCENINAKYKGKVIPIYFDVTDRELVRKAFGIIKKQHNRLDILVNNAGVEYNQSIGMISHSQMDEMFQVNVYAVIELIQWAQKMMRRQKNGSIINIASIVGNCGNRGQMVYSATKGAVIALTKSAAKELAECGIRVNAVAPGLIDTDMISATNKIYLQKRIDNIAMGRLGTPEEIGDVCVFLASDMSSYVSGQIIGVDGCAIV